MLEKLFNVYNQRIRYSYHLVQVNLVESPSDLIKQMIFNFRLLN